MKKGLLITGGSGLLALNWALAARDDYSVTLGLHAREVSLAGVNARRIDLESFDSLARDVEAIQPAMVVHTAALTNVEECERKPELAQHINVKLADNVARVCAEFDLPLIHISTDHLFSGEFPFADETCEPAPKNVYGRTKAEAEHRVLELHAKTLVVRTNFYGWGPSYRHSFSDVIINTLRAGRELTLFQDVFYAPILAEVAVQAAHDLADMNAYGICHVVGDERISKHEFGLGIAEEFGLDKSLIKVGSIADQAALVQRPHDMSLSNERTCRTLGRKLGGLNAHVARLCRQEKNGLAREIQCL
jgi:dTDP-4-dehydrorhamnose reductase